MNDDGHRLQSVAPFGWDVDCLQRRPGVMAAMILLWITDITKLARISNDNVRKRFDVAPIHNKMHESRLDGRTRVEEGGGTNTINKNGLQFGGRQKDTKTMSAETVNRNPI